jgi:hypothetical protein
VLGGIWEGVEGKCYDCEVDEWWEGGVAC